MFEGMTDSEKLHTARQLFSNLIDETRAWMRAMEEDYDFAHGRQWKDADIQKLTDEGRPALTFNLIHPILRELIGANADARRRARIMPVGPEDQATGEVLQHLTERLYNDGDFWDAEEEAFERGITAGVGYTTIDAHYKPRNPAEIEITLDCPSSLEILPDSVSSRRNLRDSKLFFWSRWLTESEFKAEYPDHAGMWKDLEAEEAHRGDPSIGYGYNQSVEIAHRGLNDYQVLSNPRFFDQKRRRVRVIRLEYMNPIKVYYVYDPRPDPRTGQPRGYAPVKRATYQAVKDSGVSDVATTWEKEYKWLEFTGVEILFDDTIPIPIDDFSINPFVCYLDHEKHKPYGVVRFLKDPQREVNKRYSQTLDEVNRQVQPGVIADEGAFEDIPRAERSMRTPGKITVKLPGKEVIVRDPPRLPEGAAGLGSEAKQMLKIVAGIDVDTIGGPHNVQEAVGTALLNYRKSLLAVTQVLVNFRAFQRKNLKLVISVIVNAMPDAQIQRLLGNDERWTVEGGVVTDQETGGVVNLSDLRALEWNVELDTAAHNTTLQLLIFQLLVELQTAGVPVDPTVMIDQIPLSKDRQMKLKEYIAQTQAAQAQETAVSQDLQKQQIDNVIAIEAAKVAQRAAAKEIEVQQERSEATLDFATDVMKAMAQADTPEKKAAVIGALQGLVQFATTQLQGQAAAQEQIAAEAVAARQQLTTPQPSPAQAGQNVA